MALTGTGSVVDGQIEVELKAARNPFQPPLTMIGAVAPKTGELVFKAALVDSLLDPAQQRRRKRPKLHGAPG